ncbi:glycosyltransferase family 39 protein [Candidatus Parcubacteria bacterium]|nr:glycosyltransferase family 39 protein [Candidatus Parcubacteria bacterium]
MEKSIASTAFPIQRTQSATLRVALLTCIPLLLSIVFFSGQSLRLDEAQSLWQTSRSATDILTLVAQDVHVPLYHELLHYWRLFTVDSVEFARLLSLLFYLASVPLLYRLGAMVYGARAGFFAATLFAISPFMNWYGNEIRMYTLFTMLVILNQYFYIKIMHKENSAWLGYITTALLGVFSHYFFFINLFAQMVFFFWRRKLFPPGAFVKFCFTATVVVLSFLPWAVYVWYQGQAGFAEPVLPIPDTTNLFSTLAQFLFGFQTDHINTFFLSLWPITLIFLFLTLRHSVRLAPETEYFLLTVVSSVCLVFFISFITPVFVSRYLIFTVPALYLLLASLLNNYPPRLAVILRAGMVMLMLLMLGIEIVNPTTPVKEDYRAAAQYFTSHSTPQDVIVLSAPFTVYPVEYYYRGATPVETLPQWDQYAHGAIPVFTEETLPSEVPKITESHQNVYLLLSYNQGYEDKVKEYFDSHFAQIESRQFSEALNLYVYRIRYDTPNSQAVSAINER